MKLFNQGERSIVIALDDMLSGDARPVKDELSQNTAYIGPNSKVEVKDACGRKLLLMYPKEILKWGE